ncbi:hypothetical protein D3C73_669510 [compost metagenome]
MGNKDDNIILLSQLVISSTCGYLSEINSFYLLGNTFDVMWIYILSIDKNDVLFPSCNDKFAISHKAQITSYYPAIRCKSLGSCLRIVVIPGHDVQACYLNTTDYIIRDRVILRVTNTHLAIIYWKTDFYKSNCLITCFLKFYHLIAHIYEFALYMEPHKFLS